MDYKKKYLKYKLKYLNARKAFRGGYNPFAMKDPNNKDDKKCIEDLLVENPKELRENPNKCQNEIKFLKKKQKAWETDCEERQKFWSRFGWPPNCENPRLDGKNDLQYEANLLDAADDPSEFAKLDEKEARKRKLKGINPDFDIVQFTKDGQKSTTTYG